MKMPRSSSSSSSESEDEEKAKLVQALDHDIFRVIKLNQSKNHESGDNVTAKNGTDQQDQPVSKRPKIVDDEDLATHKPFHLDITPASQKFIAKKLMKELDKTLKSKSPPPPSPSSVPPDTETGIRLFSTSQTILTEQDLLFERTNVKHRPKHKKKKRKKATAGSSESSSDSEEDKLRAAAVSADWVLNNA